MLGMPRMGALAVAALATLGLPLAATLPAGCKHSTHAHVSSYTPPPVPAGFGEQTGAGWRIAVPATWKDQKTSAAWAVSDPQAVDDFHANVNVVTEPFTEDSYEYARANEAALRREARAAIEVVREDVVDGDPTLLIESRWTAVPPSTVAYRILQSALASRGRGYVVTCSVATSAFERYRSTCESIVHSFAVER
jgi:hypothetical protein